MRRLAGLLFLALIGVGAAPRPSVAQSNVEAARSWGLLGTWRLDCTQPASHDNPDLKYVARDGELFHDRDFGDTTDSHRVLAARRRPDNSLELTVNFNEFHETRQYGFVHGRSGTLRTIYNRNIDTDDYSIRDGTIAGSGNPAPWQYRCD
jgi:hypothetical protein